MSPGEEYKHVHLPTLSAYKQPLYALLVRRRHWGRSRFFGSVSGDLFETSSGH